MPERGTVWVDERLLQALAPGKDALLQVGDAKFRIGAVLTLEPDRTASFFNMAPRLMMRMEDLAATGLVQEGSRIRYHLRHRLWPQPGRPCRLVPLHAAA